MTKNNFPFYFVLIMSINIFLPWCSPKIEEPAFDASLAMQYAEELMAFGPRIPGSPASDAAAQFIRTELLGMGWQVEFQDFVFRGTPLRNIIARKSSEPAQIIIGSHYDTRLLSDQESIPDFQKLPVPGANDGTSGTAIMLALAKSLPETQNSVWLVFFDGEDQGHIDQWEWSIGAEFYANNLDSYPQEVVIIDMVGDSSLNIHQERNSDQTLCDEIWGIAHRLDFADHFRYKKKYAMIDDHIPFINLGIPACLLIDFDYPHWHKQSDTLDKISEHSLHAVGETLHKWIESKLILIPKPPITRGFCVGR